MKFPRLNGVIRALESGGTAFVTMGNFDISRAQEIAGDPYDGMVFEMEHNPYDVRALRDCLQYMLNPRHIATTASVAPAVTPMVRIPPNGSELNQWIAKQVLDIGVYGIIWPHISTVEEARNAVAACRYPRPAGAQHFAPEGQRGDSPRNAARYWGLTQSEYYERADVWPLNPQGELLVAIMCEDPVGIENLPKILEGVPGIGVVIVGEGDLSQSLGVPRQYDHPLVVEAISEILNTCKKYNVVCGHPHVNRKNMVELIDRGFRWLMPKPERSNIALELGRNTVGKMTIR